MAPDPEGKQQHVVEILNVIDTGTSILLDSLPRTDYAADTALVALTNTLTISGLTRPARSLGLARRHTSSTSPRYSLLQQG